MTRHPCDPRLEYENGTRHRLPRQLGGRQSVARGRNVHRPKVAATEGRTGWIGHWQHHNRRARPDRRIGGSVPPPNRHSQTPPSASTARPVGQTIASAIRAKHRRPLIDPVASSKSKTSIRCSVLSTKYMRSPDGLHPSPFDTVVFSRTRCIGSPGAIRYSAALPVARCSSCRPTDAQHRAAAIVEPVRRTIAFHDGERLPLGRVTKSNDLMIGRRAHHRAILEPRRLPPRRPSASAYSRRQARTSGRRLRRCRRAGSRWPSHVGPSPRWSRPCGDRGMNLPNQLHQLPPKGYVEA